jgi:hypothetical protein
MVEALHGGKNRTLLTIQDGTLIFLSASFKLPPSEQHTCGLILCEMLALEFHEGIVTVLTLCPLHLILNPEG